MSDESDWITGQIIYSEGGFKGKGVGSILHTLGQLSIWAREAGKKPVSANLIGRG